MRIGKRKAIGLLVTATVSISALVALSAWGTNGLLFVVLGSVLAGSLGLGWMLAETQRQIGVAITQLITDPPEAGNVAGDQEQLLRAIHSGFLRADHTLEAFVEEWQQTRADLVTSLSQEVLRELEVRQVPSTNGEA